ncbi:unnamed protein product [Rotaria socialis]|uniref:DUF4476 domain-containing protein n=1 Tax=Rotaria socialis TaxID=392032 RepID=A0A820L0U6_9BILA|nr:unnamed protein product [Rotaria socialis]CAF3443569.1 unnamed protein product [Rotaria socialis]CAF3730595.1 unnamed protein product [Rotaria socialis]CAF4351388.1 unnamed protein product [Rotaria socialis]CAF4557908.1 unnamed protein product [Rotaria socialis]
MNSSMFDYLVRTVKKNNCPIYQMETIQVAIGAAGQVSGSQVAQLLKSVSTDDDKLELAKMAYGYAVDPASYATIVGETFSSSYTKAVLNAYIQRHW